MVWYLILHGDFGLSLIMLIYIPLLVTSLFLSAKPVDRGAGALVQWLKLPAWKVGDRGFEPHSGLQVSKKKMFFPAHT